MRHLARSSGSLSLTQLDELSDSILRLRVVGKVLSYGLVLLLDGFLVLELSLLIL